MSFTINESINTTLSYEEVCYIAVACGVYQELCSEDADKEVLKALRRLVDRLGREMYNHPDNYKPNSH